jgi:hypothetical protein
MAQRDTRHTASRIQRWIEGDVIQPIVDFEDPKQEWRRLFSELFGTFLLVLVAAGGGMMGRAFPHTISRTAAVVAPGLMVMAIILFMGRVSGAHLNPAISLAFALRRDFPWGRVPGYVVVQLAGAALAAWFLQSVIHVSATYGSTYPAAGFSSFDAFLMESVLTLGLVSVILGTASGAQNIGGLGRDRRRRLHRSGGPVGEPDLRRLHESRSNLRPGPRRGELHGLLGLCGRTTVRRAARRWGGVRPPGSRGWPSRIRRSPGSPAHGSREPDER